MHPDSITEPSDRVTFRLTFGDCDALGISYFAIYYPWMERAYSSWLHTFGLRSDRLLEEHGAFTVGMRSGCTYKLAAHLFDVLTCQIVLDHLGTTSYTLGFDFLRGEEVVAHGEILFACRNAQGRKEPMPPALLAALQTLSPRAADVTAS